MHLIDPALAHLKSQGWGTELRSNLAMDHAQFAIFRISVTLTPEGYGNPCPNLC